jgi:hypothetical protein
MDDLWSARDVVIKMSEGSMVTTAVRW